MLIPNSEMLQVPCANLRIFVGHPVASLSSPHSGFIKTSGQALQVCHPWPPLAIIFKGTTLTWGSAVEVNIWKPTITWLLRVYIPFSCRQDGFFAVAFLLRETRTVPSIWILQKKWFSLQMMLKQQLMPLLQSEAPSCHRTHRTHKRRKWVSPLNLSRRNVGWLGKGRLLAPSTAWKPMQNGKEITIRVLKLENFASSSSIYLGVLHSKRSRCFFQLQRRNLGRSQ